MLGIMSLPMRPDLALTWHEAPFGDDIAFITCMRERVKNAQQRLCSIPPCLRSTTSYRADSDSTNPRKPPQLPLQIAGPRKVVSRLLPYRSRVCGLTSVKFSLLYQMFASMN